MMASFNGLELTVLTMVDERKFSGELGSRLAACRREVGLSQTQLANIMGQCQQTIADYETGRRRIPAYKLASIADALGVSASDLLDDAGRESRKRGPASRLEQLAAQASKLPRSRQRFVIEMLENAVIRVHA